MTTTANTFNQGGAIINNALSRPVGVLPTTTSNVVHKPFVSGGINNLYSGSNVGRYTSTIANQGGQIGVRYPQQTQTYVT